MSQGYNALLQTTTAGVTATNEACELKIGKTYQIIDRNKRIWDRYTLPIVYVNGNQVASTNIKAINYLTGRIIFADNYNVSGPVTVDVKYLPIVTIGYATELQVTEKVDLSDITNFVTTSADLQSGESISRRKTVLTVSATGSIKGLLDLYELPSDNLIVVIQPDKNNTDDITYIECIVTLKTKTQNVEAMNEIEISFESNYPVEYE